ncbi:30S ribosomal protein S7 [Striga asiatica]|uniref:30S ribosomal protein S7 n=1 Tax=Striga asiatica TaxID=4170 RepID=A0A5A7PND5_STRAF|nr:30S ribosomal protein S7 [Striga asiatica]
MDTSLKKPAKNNTYRIFEDWISKLTISSSNPLITTPPFPSSISANGFFDLSSLDLENSSGAKRSVMSSLYNSRKETFMLYSLVWPSKISKICFTALGITPASLGNSPF